MHNGVPPPDNPTEARREHDVYMLIETSGLAPATPAPYGTLSEATEALVERALFLARRPGTRVLVQRPRHVVLANAGGTRTTIQLRHLLGT